MRKGIIYKATNLINGKIYIGKTIQKFVRRKNNHIRHASNNLDNFYFHNAIRKYGIENFKWEIIYECNDGLLLNLMETMKIIINHSHVSEGGYNMTWGGDGQFGRICSDETKRNISKKLKGRKLTDEHRIKVIEGLKGRKMTEYNKKRLFDVKLKSYIIEVISTGKIYYVNNSLKEFCKNHPEYNANYKGLSACARNKQRKHKGLMCRYNNDNIN
jgi:group I intron endonuclease